MSDVLKYSVEIYKKKMVFFSYDFPPFEGGISRLCIELVKKIVDNNWETKVLSVKRPGFTGYHDVMGDIVRLPSKRGVLEFNSLVKLICVSRKVWIVTGVWYPEALLAMLAGHRKVIVLAHGNDVMTGDDTIKNSILNWLRKVILRKAKLVICNSNYTQQIVRNQIPSARTVVSLLGVDENKFCPADNKTEIRKRLGLPQNKKLILTVARVEKYKAHDMVIRAIAALQKEEQKKICYCIAGRGPYVDELKNLAVELDVVHVIYWYGFVEEENLPDLYRCSDLFVLCTREERGTKKVEGFGLVFLEAQASGVPVIGADQGGVSDAVSHGNGGWLIKKDDVKELTLYLLRLINDLDLFNKEGQRARARVEAEATWGHFASHTLKEINAIAGYDE